jgi:C-terminal processing protease CtpA/Prc
MNKNSLLLLLLGGVAAAAGGVFARDYIDSGKTGQPLVSERPSNKLLASIRQDPSDIEISEVNYFNQIADLLKSQYVEEINDDIKLATGAVRGMIFSLDDPDTMFYDPDQFRVFRKQLDGVYEGIGATFMMIPPVGIDEATVAKIPELVITSVAPGGPAHRAGLKAGDRIDSVDNHWLLNSKEIQNFRTVLNKAVNDPSQSEKLKQLRKEIREKSAKAILPLRAIERLWSGTEGSIQVIARRGSQEISTTLQKAETKVPMLALNGSTLQVQLRPGIGQELSKFLASNQGTVKSLDLRNNWCADKSVLIEFLSALNVSGKVGKVTTARKNKEAEVISLPEASGMQKFTVLVDESTRGIAAAAASVLKAKGMPLQGTPSNSRVVTEVVNLPNNSGYTLRLGDFVTEVAK